MLAIASKQLNSTFERIVRDKNGVLVRVRFTVVEIEGKLSARIISAEPVVTKSQDVVYLPVSIDAAELAQDVTPSFISKISPYISLDFFMSQPTRAPAFI